MMDEEREGLSKDNAN